MRHATTDPELLGLVRRFVTPGRRYLRLGGSLLRLSGPERLVFARELVQAALEITPAELDVLFEGGWRERKTASWLVVVAGRTEFRSRIGELLMASEGPYAGAAYCVTLATFGDSRDADLLCLYLDRHLLRPDLDYDQGFALGALLHLDATLGSERASGYLAEGACGRSGPTLRREGAVIRRRTARSWTSSAPSPTSVANTLPHWKTGTTRRPRGGRNGDRVGCSGDRQMHQNHPARDLDGRQRTSGRADRRGVSGPRSVRRPVADPVSPS
ncbi:DUF6000 family protein [Kitasatospora sp. NPDC001261]|uniref:DUF6000 family protein n=1 Tax=Kitasatospora sp. NPDC001261 TaxID=3364012 RepID=UPI0036BE9678